MDLRKIADRLGIAEYPADLTKVIPIDVCNLELIANLHKEFNIFREHYEDVVNGAKALKNDPDTLVIETTGRDDKEALDAVRRWAEEYAR